MFSKTNLISTLIVALWAFFGGYLLWGKLIDPFNANHLGTATGVMKDPTDINMMYVAIGSLIVAFVLSTLYSKWARGSHSIAQGAQFGIGIGIIIGFGDRLVEYGVANLFDFTGTLVNGLTTSCFLQ